MIGFRKGESILLLLGNIAAFVGCIIMVAIGLIKKKEHILTAQCFQFAFMGLGNLALGATAGVISNGISIVRNLLFTRVQSTTAMKVGFIAVQAVLTLITGGTALIEWLPVTAVVVYTWCLDLKNDVAFKVMIIGCQLLWTVYDLYYQNYVAFAFDLLTVVSTVLGIFRIKKEKR